MQRPELCMGSVEYTATKEYCKVSRWVARAASSGAATACHRSSPFFVFPQNGTLPKQPAFLFMMDVSAGPLHNGTVNLLAQNVSKMINSLPR